MLTIILVVIIATIFDIVNEFINKIRKRRLDAGLITVIDTEAEPQFTVTNQQDEQILLVNESIQQHYTKKQAYLNIVQSLSIHRNFQKIFVVSSDEKQILCLNAIRFISLAWVILGHTYLFIGSFAGFF